MSRILPIEENGQTVAYYFDCPGCKHGHAPYVKPNINSVGASWNFNGNLDLPSFHPSILTRITPSGGKEMVCHCFVTDGRIRFLSDSTHWLSGQTVDLPEV